MSRKPVWEGSMRRAPAVRENVLHSGDWRQSDTNCACLVEREGGCKCLSGTPEEREALGWAGNVSEGLRMPMCAGRTLQT